jgi:hypothetical protein
MAKVTGVQPRSARPQRHWFAASRRGGSVILHHSHIRPLLERDWSTPMDGIEATIWASQSGGHPVRRGHETHGRSPTGER